ncbi:MAG TPA: hypothetical protein VN832_02490 [Stellaceae bacterium]|nr:hypothetical protein [Stellaceae bacterium]
MKAGRDGDAAKRPPALTPQERRQVQQLHQCYLARQADAARAALAHRPIAPKLGAANDNQQD